MSHHKDLSQMNTEEAFMYSNDTESAPEDESSLRRIAGVDSSSVATYPSVMRMWYETRVGDLSFIETSKKFCTSSIPLKTLIRGTVNDMASR